MASPTCWARTRAAHAGVTTLVVGAGHSAMNAVLDLVEAGRGRAGHAHPLAFRRPLGAVNFGGGARTAWLGAASRGAGAGAGGGRGR
jgi:hypothetical protein